MTKTILREKKKTGCLTLPDFKYITKLLSQTVQGAMTKYRLGSLNNRNLYLIVWDVVKPWNPVYNPIPARAPFVVCRW